MATPDLNDRLTAVPVALLQHDFAGVIDAIDELERVTDKPSALDPSWFVYRGVAQYLSGRFADARRSYETAISIDPQHVPANLNLSYLLASCPDESLHDAARAIELARGICELTSWKEWYALQALAGALARAGNFVDARHHATRADRLVPADQRWRVTRLLELIDAQQPFTANLDDDLQKLHSDWAPNRKTKPSDPPHFHARVYVVPALLGAAIGAIVLAPFCRCPGDPNGHSIAAGLGGLIGLFTGIVIHTVRTTFGRRP